MPTRPTRSRTDDGPKPDWHQFAEWFNETLLSTAVDYSRAVSLRHIGTERVRGGEDLERAKSWARASVPQKSYSPKPSKALAEAYELIGQAIEGKATPADVAEMVRTLAPQVDDRDDSASLERWGQRLERAETWRDVAGRPH